MDFEKEIIEYENTNYDRPYIVKIGLIPVIITAPHGIKQTKSDGKIKLSEPFTKAITQYIANQTNASFLIKTKDTKVDANSEEKENFKDTLLYLIKKHNIKLLIDIHGAKKERDFDIEFGTLNNLSIDYTVIKELEDAFKEEGIKNIVYNNPFKGGGITRYIYANTNIDIIQIEINQKYRDYNNIENIQKVCNALNKFINQYISYLK